MSCERLTWCSGYSARTAAAPRSASSFKLLKVGAPRQPTAQSAEPFAAVYALSTLTPRTQQQLNLTAGQHDSFAAAAASQPASQPVGQPASKQPFLFVHDRNSYEKENVRVLSSSVTVRLLDRLHSGSFCEFYLSFDRYKQKKTRQIREFL